MNEQNGQVEQQERDRLATMSQQFNQRMAVGVSIAGAVIIPIGLILSGVLAGWRGLAGSFVGFGVASLNTIAVMRTLKWALSKPLSVMPTILMATMWPRLILVAALLFGLTYVRALDTLAMLLSFLALFFAYTNLEAVYAYRAFGFILRPGGSKTISP